MPAKDNVYDEACSGGYNNACNALGVFPTGKCTINRTIIIDNISPLEWSLSS